MVERAGFEVIDPWVGPGGEAIERALGIRDPGVRQRELARADLLAANLNRQSIERADLVFAVLDGSDVDSGTASEIGYATARGKPVLGYRGDFRQARENEGMLVNLQVQGFIELSGGRVSRSLEEARQQLEAFRTRY